MKELNIDYRTHNGIHKKVSFKQGINILSGSAGSGKTLLMRMVTAYCIENNIKCYYFNSKDSKLTEKEILDICKDCDVVCFDNGDLYMTRGLLDNLRKTNKIIILELKITFGLGVSHCPQYFVSYKNKEIKTRCNV